MSFFSSPEQLAEIEQIIRNYIRLPFSRDCIPGAVMEGVIAHVRSAQVLNTYDYVDVVEQGRCYGWQVKSTKDDTPVTWKRAKIAGADKLIEESYKSEEGKQRLGDAIIEFCNKHARESIEHYGLEKIGYCRLITHGDGRITYFERLLCTHEKPSIFNPADFIWRWSTPKKTTKKEQLPAFHGIHRETGEGWWAWHGLGENQLHFKGEKNWWPKPGDPHARTFLWPSNRLSLAEFSRLLSNLDAVT